MSDDDTAQIADEIWKAFDNLIQLAIKEKVLFVVLAGDIYNDAEKQDKLQGKFRDALQELGDHEIPVFIIHGNHDPLGDDTRLRRSLPSNVKVFRKNDPEEFLGAQDGEDKIMVAGVSFGSKQVPENLAARFKNLPLGDAKWRVGLLHTSLEGVEGHGDYAPCDKDDLRNAPVGYWALGHVHLRSINPLGPGRWWAYSGNLQGMHFKPSECHPKGALLVKVSEQGFEAPEFRALDTLRFKSIEVSVESAESTAACYQLVSDEISAAEESCQGRRLVARVVLTGRVHFYKRLLQDIDNGEFLEKLCSDFGSEWDKVIVTDVRARSLGPPIDPVKLREGDDLLATALRKLDGYPDGQLISSFKNLLLAKDYTKLATLTDENPEIDNDVKVQSTHGAQIRELVERFLTEGIRNEEEEIVAT